MNRQLIRVLLTIVGVVACATPSQAQEPESANALPMTTSTSAALYFPKPLTYPQQIARYEAEQRAMRMEYNRWIGFDPARPATNSSWMYSGLYNFTPSVSYSVAYGSRHRFYGW